ncbi:DUF2203 domain-containing protein [Brevibacillus sp. SYP-B805]|uniref:DUF2203 domain-containing protein n=1 Tax=Brevibacillus sp. SYP-B805 TaxID=1578199 RepID=UPI0013EA87B5|nr:DUF2203 domain-containing protein [Brevibacillus sp. SYP-B805]NGQ96242.1 DUF2203 domain-containing protein [Brevibacillus sp. SYP-B805]
MEKKYFTLEEANQLLPVVQTELTYLQSMKKEFFEKYQELQHVKKRMAYHTSPDAALHDAVFTLECELDFLDIEARLRLKQLYERGIQIKDIDSGLVDFPAMLDGAEVLWCWKQGEAQITHYHGVNEGFAGRKQIK